MTDVERQVHIPQLGQQVGESIRSGWFEAVERPDGTIVYKNRIYLFWARLLVLSLAATDELSRMDEDFEINEKNLVKFLADCMSRCTIMDTISSSASWVKVTEIFSKNVALMVNSKSSQASVMGALSASCLEHLGEYATICDRTEYTPVIPYELWNEWMVAIGDQRRPIEGKSGRLEAAFSLTRALHDYHESMFLANCACHPKQRKGRGMPLEVASLKLSEILMENKELWELPLRKLAELVGCSASQLGKTNSWKALMLHRGKKPPRLRARSLSPYLEAEIASNRDSNAAVSARVDDDQILNKLVAEQARDDEGSPFEHANRRNTLRRIL